jgi:hypothetical protein
MIDMAVKYIGIGIRVLKDPITLDEFSAQRLGKFRLVKLYKMGKFILITQFIHCNLHVRFIMV